MTADWMTTPTGQRVLQHQADPRPAWLWSLDGSTLLWSNSAAAYFLAKIKKHGIKFASTAVPIKGQVTRIARLGSIGRSSLSRVQFLAGDKPASSTCACTPLDWDNGQIAVLIVGVDPIAPEFFEDDERVAVRDADASVATTEVASPAVEIPAEQNPVTAEAPFEPVTAESLPVDEPLEATPGAESSTEFVQPELQAEPLVADDVPVETSGDAPAPEQPTAPQADTVEEPPVDPIAGFINADQRSYASDLDQWHEAIEQTEPQPVFATTAQPDFVTAPVPQDHSFVPSETGGRRQQPIWRDQPADAPRPPPTPAPPAPVFDVPATQQEWASSQPAIDLADAVQPEQSSWPDQPVEAPAPAEAVQVVETPQQPYDQPEFAGTTETSESTDAQPDSNFVNADATVQTDPWAVEQPAERPAVEPTPAPANRLSGLMDRMASHADLYSPLTDADDVVLSDVAAEMAAQAPELFRVTGRGFAPDAHETTDAQNDVAALAQFDGEGGMLPEIAEAEAPVFAEQAEAVRDAETAEQNAVTDAQDLQVLDGEGGVLPEIAEAEAPEFAAQAEALRDAETDAQNAVSDAEELQVLDSEGGLLPEVATAEAPEFAEQAAMLAQPAPDAEQVERVSRYNFDELSRILNDRVGDPSQQATSQGNSVATVPGAPSGALINLGGETLVLNRLPLGILVFRDQQVLFANRAITEMVGYDSVENLRSAGLAAIFPAMGPDGHEAGPVNHLVQRDGSLVPVTARLQSISWQGRPALMLSASTTEVRTGHEGAVRAFAEAFADARRDGFFETNRAATINSSNDRASALLGGGPDGLAGRPLSNMIDPRDLPEFKAFLERPARFAETARPCIAVAGNHPGVELLIFAQGQSGVLSGYFGFVHRSETSRAPAQLGNSGEPEPALLARISRGVRRPLNTIIGFSDLIRGEAFGALQNDRYEAYAQDIRTAGHEIAALVDELDDYARLKDGRYLPQRASIELSSLLESCVQRVRQQASAARVIVRSAISEKLERITADRASLAQAVLNLLASAIDQTPTGGAVVISAQTEDDGAIAIHVRDSGTSPVDMAERFVVFRDGVGRDGVALAPVRSSVGLALTRSLLAVNAFSLKVDPAGEQGMLFSLLIPADLVDYPPQY